MEQRPSALRRPLLAAADSLDARYGGAALYVETPWAGTPLRRRLRGGVSSGALKVEDGDAGSRSLAFAEATGAWTASRGTTSLAMTATANGSAGRTMGAGWTRGIGTAAARVRFSGLNARGVVTYGAVSSSAPAWERFVVGGGRPELFDPALTPQRVPMPLARTGVVRGRELLTWRASTDLNGVTPYLAAASADAGHRTWYRVAGVEAAFDTPPLNLLRLPAVHVVAGVGEPLTAPDRHRLRVYGGVSYRP
jgi:hypothetical protein